MGYDGPQSNCATCGWANFTIRRRCRNCGNPLTGTEEQPAATQTTVATETHSAKPIVDPAFRRIVQLPFK